MTIKHLLKLTPTLSLAVLILSCNNSPDYKETRQQVMELHDKLMIDGEIAVKNKMKLDTLSKYGLKKFKLADQKLDTITEKQHIAVLIDKLNEADERMMDWMHEFQADVEGKNNAQAVAYFNGEKVKLNKLDSIYRIALQQSDAYLKKFKINMQKELHSHSH